MGPSSRGALNRILAAIIKTRGSPLPLDEAICYPRGAMTSTKSTLLPHEVADLLEIRLARVAQLIRTGILPYLETSDLPLVKRTDALLVLELFPLLIECFRVEKLEARCESIAENDLSPLSYRRPSTVALLKCVNAAHPTVPIGR